MTQYDGIGWRKGTTCVALGVVSVVARRARQLPNTVNAGPSNPDSQKRPDCLRVTLEDLRPDTLFDRLDRIAVPPRLQHVAAGAGAASGNILYRIVR
jgi:hypothetical protein